MLTKLKIFFVLVLLHISLVYADTKPVTQLKSFLATTKTLTANFKQVVFDESGKVKQTSYGVFNLSRPGKFRWNYQKPFTQEIVSNAGKVWFYDADLEQVTIKRLDKSMGSTPALLLTGDVELEKEFTMARQGSEDGMQWIKLVPKNPESSFKYVLIGLNDGELGGMELSDNFGQLTRIYFSEVEINPQIRPEEFTFVPPKGVDVLEDKEQDKALAKTERKHKKAENFQDDGNNELEKPQETVENKDLEQPVQEKVETTVEKPLETEPKKEPSVQVVPVEVQPEETTPDEPETADIAAPVHHRHKAKASLHSQEKAHDTANSGKDKHKDKEKSKDKSHDKSKDKEKSKDKSHDKDKKDKSKDKSHDNDKKDKSKNKSHDKDKKDKSKDKSHDKSKKDKKEKSNKHK